MYKISILSLLLLSYLNCVAQNTIASFPKNLQLYVRGDNNVCDIEINGVTNDPSITKLELELYRNDTLVYQEYRAKGSFEFLIPIKAELSEYTFKLNKVTGSGKTLLRSAEKVLCGEAILLYGQSNMSAISGVNEFNADYSDKFMRNFNTTHGLDTTNYVWQTAKHPYASIGSIGNHLMLALIDSLKIPFLTLNPSEGGAQIWRLSARNPANHFDQNYNYGKMLTRLKQTDVLSKIRFMAFFQGEAAAGNWYADCNAYPAEFQTLMSQIREDIPALRKFYMFQINILFENNNYVERAGYLRDFQRRTKELYPGFVEIISTVGMDPYDGVHFGGPAYAQMAHKLSKLVLRDIYGKPNASQIESPNLQYAYYNSTKDSVILEFQKGQNLSYPSDINYGHYTRSLKNFIYFTNDNQTIHRNQSNQNVISGLGAQNIVKLKLSGSQNFKYITYLPSTFSDTYSVYYNGPFIANSSGLNAFTFYCFPIANSPRILNPSPVMPVNVLAAGISADRINVLWEIPGNETVTLEASLDSVNFISIYTGTSNFFTHSGLSQNTKYYFRIKSCNSYGCTSFSPIRVATTHKIVSYTCPELVFKQPIDHLIQNYHGRKINIQAGISNSSIHFEAGQAIEFLPGVVLNAASSSSIRANIKLCP